MRTRPHRTIQNEQRCDEQVAEREHAACARPRRPFTTGSPGAGVPLSAEREHADEPSRALPCGSDAFPTHTELGLTFATSLSLSRVVSLDFALRAKAVHVCLWCLCFGAAAGGVDGRAEPVGARPQPVLLRPWQQAAQEDHAHD